MSDKTTAATKDATAMETASSELNKAVDSLASGVESAAVTLAEGVGESASRTAKLTGDALGVTGDGKRPNEKLADGLNEAKDKVTDAIK